jgi:hypothetical protein
MTPLPLPNHQARLALHGSFAVITTLRMKNAPAGTQVLVRLGGNTFRSSGNREFTAIANRRVSYGSELRITYVQAGRIGRYKVVKMTKSGFAQVRTGCTRRGTATPGVCP